MSKTILAVYENFIEGLRTGVFQEQIAYDSLREEIIEAAKNSKQEIDFLINIFYHEKEIDFKLLFASCLIKLGKEQAIIPFLTNLLDKKFEESMDNYMKYYAMILLASFGDQQGLEAFRQHLKEEEHVKNPRDYYSVYNDLGFTILEVDKDNPYIKYIIFEYAQTGREARIFYESFYNEKIDDPNIDA